MTRICYIDGLCFQRSTGILLIYKYNNETNCFCKIQEITSGNVPKNMLNVFNNFSMKNIELCLEEIEMVDSSPTSCMDDISVLL